MTALGSFELTFVFNKLIICLVEIDYSHLYIPNLELTAE